MPDIPGTFLDRVVDPVVTFDGLKVEFPQDEDFWYDDEDPGYDEPDYTAEEVD